ncbi:hypothetical protein [Ralstonia pseudosolanacearum]|uniref:hypothetical protein n=1 Tax=Ralstonia pseudosolanacearum TaxID=1310165 RepID=UPI0023DB8339|nr:hypothetical protein [Ralstonia pseudosolanacearum]
MVDDFIGRQLALIEQAIFDYEGGRLNLNSLVSRIEGASLAVGSDSWSGIVYPLVGALEEVNALALDEGRGLDSEDQRIVGDALSKLKSAIQSYRSGPAS